MAGVCFRTPQTPRRMLVDRSAGILLVLCSVGPLSTITAATHCRLYVVDLATSVAPRGGLWISTRFR